MTLRFRTKLILLMTLVVAGVTGATLYLTQQQVQATYERIFEAQFRSQVAYFTSEQQRLQRAVAVACEAALAKESFLNALRDHRAQSVFDDVVTQVVEALEPLRQRTAADGADSQEARIGSRPFIALASSEGRIIATNRPNAAPPANGAGPRNTNRATGVGERMRWFQDKTVAEVLQEQAVGYLVVTLPSGIVQAREGLLTPVRLPGGAVIAALFVGYPLPDFSERALLDFSRQTKLGDALSGVWLEGEIYSSTIPEEVRRQLAALLERTAHDPASSSENAVLDVKGESYRVYHTPLNPGSPLPHAEQVCLYSLKTAEIERDHLAWRIGGFGLMSFAAACVLILFISQHLSRPLSDLQAGTQAIRGGRYDVRLPVRSLDEVGMVTASFNEMAEGLAMKEKFRTVLDLVADKEVAEQMLAGGIALGGETREVTVLFCDLRGFTSWSRSLPPEEVVHWLNMHMTAMTRVVYEHGGIVDKFIGDALMAVFGAPKSRGDDAFNASMCAVRMMEERARLNTSTACQLEIGIGVASGTALAGNMGADNRLNYTVTGECVNLASRLADKAERMEALIDKATQRVVRDRMKTEPANDLMIKGFDAPVAVWRLKAIAV